MIRLVWRAKGIPLEIFCSESSFDELVGSPASLACSMGPTTGLAGFFAWHVAARADRDLVFQDCSNRVKERGLTSPYLKNFVVSRVNPLRFIKGDPPSFDELLDTMTKRARGFKVDKIKNEDLASAGGPLEDAD